MFEFECGAGDVCVRACLALEPSTKREKKHIESER